MENNTFRARCFVIQPFGTKRAKKENSPVVDNDKVFEALKSLERIQPNFKLEIYRGDTEQVRRENLHSHVSDCIKNSHFCIADLTGQNANVLYETGVARGYGRKVIIICQDKDDIPSDLDGAIYVVYKINEINHLASNIQQHFGRVQEEIEEYRDHHGLGRVTYISKRKNDLIKSKIRKSKSRIDILQTNLCILEQGFMGELTEALKENENLNIRILTLDPQSIFVNYRAEQLDLNVKRFRNELEEALVHVSSYFAEYAPRVRIKLYDDFPAQITFYFDQEIISCVVSSTGKSRNNCAFIIPENMPGAHSSFSEHFSRLWTVKGKDI